MELARSFVAIASSEPLALQSLPSRDERRPMRAISWHLSKDSRLAVGVCLRDPDDHDARGPWLIGDPAELGEPGALTGAPSAMVNAATAVLDAEAARIMIGTSIVSLPPVFLFREPGRVFASSDLYLLTQLPGVSLHLDPAGICDMGRIGFPVEGRTPFAGVRLLPAASRVELDAAGEHREFRTWGLKQDTEPLVWKEFVEQQVEAFRLAVGRLDLSRSILSLTGGLDTRTIFALLAHEGRLCPAVTMSGPTRSLDARIAGELCRHYDVPHRVVCYDQDYLAELPRYVEDASLLSGGLASFDWASEVYFYHALGEGPRARLSGNLGNQVGRGGTEGFSTRGADLGLLAPDFRESVAETSAHWMDNARTDSGIDPEFLLHREVPFASAANFQIGNHFAAQQSPYASREMVETLGSRPRSHVKDDSSMLRLRLRDLKHRFLGEPEGQSFQQYLICQLGGFAATCPINWGWRAKGGVSLRGTASGLLTLVGMVAASRGLEQGALGSLLAPAVALHDFRRPRQWLLATLREFASDRLHSKELLESGIFDAVRLEQACDEHFSGAKDHHTSLVFALDVALAREFFTKGA